MNRDGENGENGCDVNERLDDVHEQLDNIQETLVILQDNIEEILEKLDNLGLQGSGFHEVVDDRY